MEQTQIVLAAVGLVAYAWLLVRVASAAYFKSKLFYNRAVMRAMMREETHHGQ